MLKLIIIMKNVEYKPSDFSAEYPWSCVFETAEHEIVAMNVMKILKRTGNEFRDLSFDEYKIERLKDGNFSGIEEGYFNEVIWFYAVL